MATKLGKEFNQIAVFDLKGMKEIPTGGTGENVGQFGSESTRAGMVQSLVEARS